MMVLAFIAGLVFLATLLVLLATFKNLADDQTLAEAQEEVRKETYSGPIV